MQAPPNGWIPGKHDFHLPGLDNEGNWSNVKTRDHLGGRVASTTCLPAH